MKLATLRVTGVRVRFAVRARVHDQRAADARPGRRRGASGWATGKVGHDRQRHGAADEVRQRRR